MYDWWPYPELVEHIPALRSLGRKQIKPVLRNSRFSFEFPERSLAEMRLEVMATPVQALLSNVLADGVKLFEMPAGMGALEQIELPIRVIDYTPPFPAQIVKTPAGEHHFVVKQGGLFMIAKFDPNNVVDMMCCYQETRTLEDYLKGEVHNCILGKSQKDDFQHRFRGTLNFLLLCMLEGKICEGRQPLRKNQRNNLPLKVANPERYKMQEIRLFRSRTKAALETASACGSSKRPHHRRSHWRYAAVGVGRMSRKLVLIPAMFINKHKIADIGEIDYTAKF